MKMLHDRDKVPTQEKMSQDNAFVTNDEGTVGEANVDPSWTENSQAEECLFLADDCKEKW